MVASGALFPGRRQRRQSPSWEAIQRKQGSPHASSWLDRTSFVCRCRGSFSPRGCPESVDILLSLMSALSLPCDYMVIEQGGEVFIEPVSAC